MRILFIALVLKYDKYIFWMVLNKQFPTLSREPEKNWYNSLFFNSKLSSAGCWCFNIGISFDSFLCASFLMSPLHVITNAYIWHPHVKAHVLLIGVPFAKHLWALVVFAEWHNHAKAELPILPIIRKVDYWNILTPTNFFTPQIVLGSHILSWKDKTPVHKSQVGIAAPVVIM